MKTKNNTQHNGNTQEKFLLASVGVFLKNGTLETMTVQNSYGAISVSRTIPEKSNTFAIGFAADFEDNDTTEEEAPEGYFEYDEEEEKRVIEKYVRWFE